MREAGLLRLGAQLVGALLLTLVAAFCVVLFARALHVRWSPPVPEVVRDVEKARYLAQLETVDPESAPNFVVILFDDLGWGDLSVQGNRLIETPRIDEAASQGVRFTQFYSSSAACTPSRASLLTGRYPPRAGASLHVFFPEDSWVGFARRLAGVPNELPADEILLPEALRAAGYATGMVGKWHLGELDGYRPLSRGFEDYFGVLWSNDMAPLHLYRGDEVVQEDLRPRNGFGERDEEFPLGTGGVEQARLTERYTDEAVRFLEEHQEDPFFLYVAHTFPHVPLYPSSRQAGRSAAGRYGDVVADLDQSTGEILDALERLGLTERTLVLITSDNGADYGGSPGALRGRKGQILEGGQRVPLIARWPGTLPPGLEVESMAMNIDFFPTLLSLAGVPLPKDRMIDGRDLRAVLASGAESPHDLLYYFSAAETLPGAVRDARYKFLLETGDWGRNRAHLSRLDVDAEAHDLRHKHPQVAEGLLAALTRKRLEFTTNPRGWRSHRE